MRKRPCNHLKDTWFRGKNEGNNQHLYRLSTEIIKENKRIWDGMKICEEWEGIFIGVNSTIECNEVKGDLTFMVKSC